MEEDVEIELLYKTHGQILMEAAATEQVGNEEEQSRVCEEISGEDQVVSVERAPNNTVADKKHSSRKPKRRKKFNFTKKSVSKIKKQVLKMKKEVLDDSSIDVEDLLETHVASCLLNRSRYKSNRESDDESNTSFEGCEESNDFVNEILNDDYMFRQKNPEFGKAQRENNRNTSSDDRCLLELKSLQEMIDQREDLLEKIERKLKEELIDNEGEQRQVRESINALSQNEFSKLKEPSMSKCFFKKFGMPYFRDSSGFPAPPNDDTKKKLENNELVITSLPKLKYWRKCNKDKLQDSIQLTLIEENTDKLLKKIVKLKDILKNVTDEQAERKIKDKIDKYQDQVKKIKHMSYLDLLSNENPDREYDWLKYSATDLNELHSPEECKRFWHLYLKPSINKSRWERSEDENLKEIAEEMNFQDWESIAQSLGTNRTAYQCLVHYRNRLCDKQEYSIGKWTREEDEKLMNVINSAKIGDFIPWTKVASYMGDRTHNQVYNRYVNCLDPKLVKGRFSAEEDLLIVSGIEVFGVTYKEMASLMSNRTPNQIRERYERHLLPKTAKTGTFSLEEDEQLLRLVDKYGKGNFALIADEMKTRSRTQVRQRYNRMMRSVKNRPGWTPAQVKRRNCNKVSKNLTLTQKKVEKLKREVEQVEKSFQLTKLESEAFKIEKLKELRDNLFLKKFDLKKYKKKTSSEYADINGQLLEFFKCQHLKNPVQSSTLKNNEDNSAYLNEILLLAKYFGHDLQLPRSEVEIWKNKNLKYNLKAFLIETLKSQVDKAAGDKQDAVEIISTSVREHPGNVDYLEPEVDDTLIMENHWYNASINVSNLNFSEFLKRTVFDYSNGMHQDIWNSKINRSREAIFSDVINISVPPSDQPYFFPPNSVTTLGFKSMLLSRTRLKHDTTGLSDVEVKKSSAFHHLVDQFQETLLSLFYCPKVLSLTDFTSTLLSTVNHSTSSSQSMINHDGIVHLLNDLNQKTPDIVRKVAQPIMSNALKEKKMKINILEHNKSYQRQLQEFKMGITYKRKMNIEHLVKNSKEPNKTNTQVKKKRKKKKYNAGHKAKKLKNDNNTLIISDSENSNDSPNNKCDNEDIISGANLKRPCHTYSRIHQSPKRHLDSDKHSEQTVKMSICFNSESTKSTRNTPNQVDELCLKSISRAATSTK